MGRYNAPASLACGATAAKPMLVITGDGNVQPEVIMLVAGFSATPDDKAYLFALYEVSDAGTGGTAITPKAIGHGGTSAVTAKKGTYTTDPTKTGVAMLQMPVYQRSSAKVQKARGEGYSPTAYASAKGLGIFVDVTPASINSEFEQEWYE